MTTWMQNRSDLAKFRIARFSAAFLLRGISAAHPRADHGGP